MEVHLWPRHSREISLRRFHNEKREIARLLHPAGRQYAVPHRLRRQNGGTVRRTGGIRSALPGGRTGAGRSGLFPGDGQPGRDLLHRGLRPGGGPLPERGRADGEQRGLPGLHRQRHQGGHRGIRAGHHQLLLRPAGPGGHRALRPVLRHYGHLHPSVQHHPVQLPGQSEHHQDDRFEG